MTIDPCRVRPGDTTQSQVNWQDLLQIRGWTCMWKMVMLGPPDQCLTYKPHDWFPPVASLLNWRTIISIKRQIFRYDKLNIFMVNYFHRGWQVKLASKANQFQFISLPGNYHCSRLNFPSLYQHKLPIFFYLPCLIIWRQICGGVLYVFVTTIVVGSKMNFLTNFLWRSFIVL